MDDDELVVGTRYSLTGARCTTHLASGASSPISQGSPIVGHGDTERREQFATGHTAQHLAYLASVMALGPRPSTGGTIDIGDIRAYIAHSADEGTIDPHAVIEAYRRGLPRVEVTVGVQAAVAV